MSSQFEDFEDFGRIEDAIKCLMVGPSPNIELINELKGHDPDDILLYSPSKNKLFILPTRNYPCWFASSGLARTPK